MKKKLKPSLFATYIKQFSKFAAEFSKFRKEVAHFNTKVHNRLDAASIQKIKKGLK